MVSYNNQHVPQLVYQKNNSEAAIFLGGVHAAGIALHSIVVIMFMFSFLLIFLKENLQWLEDNGVTVILSVGTMPFGIAHFKDPETYDDKGSIEFIGRPDADTPPNCTERNDDEETSLDDEENTITDSHERKETGRKSSYPKHYRHLFIALEDDPSEDLLSHLKKTNVFIDEALDAGLKILVHW